LKNAYLEAFKSKEQWLLKENARLVEEEEKLKNFHKDTDTRNENQMLIKRAREEYLNKIQVRISLKLFLLINA